MVHDPAHRLVAVAVLRESLHEHAIATVILASTRTWRSLHFLTVMFYWAHERKRGWLR